MTMTETKPGTKSDLDKKKGSLFGDPLAGMGGWLLNQRPTDEPKLLDIPDIRAAMRLVNGDRIQPRYQLGATESNTQCLYSDTFNGLPSCIAGTIIAILAPEWYASSVKGDRGGVAALPRVESVFTQRAIDLLRRMQAYADGRDGGAQETWSSAFHNAALDLLSVDFDAF